MEQEISAQLHRVNYLVAEADALYHKAALHLGISDSTMMVRIPIPIRGLFCAWQGKDTGRIIWHCVFFHTRSAKGLDITKNPFVIGWKPSGSQPIRTDFVAGGDVGCERNRGMERRYVMRSCCLPR